MTHPIFSLIFFNNLIEVITLIQSDPGAVRVEASSERSHETPLHTASQLGYIEICRYLLDHGADVNSKDSLGATPLHVSCRNGQAEVTKLLLSRGANVEGIVGNENFGNRKVAYISIIVVNDVYVVYGKLLNHTTQFMCHPK